MYEELNISESEGVWAAYLALCDLKEETERLQAACAAKTAELAELREQTAELFAERVAAEGADDDAVHAAMVMWVSDPQSAAQAVLGCDIAEAANPYGCNQYGHEWRAPHGANWRARGRGVEKKNEKQPEQNNSNKAKPYNVAPKKEIHVDNPKFKPEVNEHLRNIKTVAQQEKAVYDSITKGNLSSTELQNKLKEWRELQNKYYEVLDDFKNKNVGVNVTEQNEVYHTEVKTEDDIMEHYEEISKRYPDKVHAANPYGCNQYGHEWKGKHGEGWKPSGRGGNEKQGEKKEETSKDGKKRDRESAASGIQDKKSKKIVNDAEKFFKESEEAFSKYKNDKRNPYDKVELLKQWRQKYMDFFAQSRAFFKLRNSGHYITDSDRNQVLDYFDKREEEIMKQYDVVLEEIPSFLGK